MSQYLLTVFHDAGVQASGEVYADEAQMQEMFRRVSEFNEKLIASDQFVTAFGLTPPEQAVVVDARGDQTTTTPGPRATADAYPGGVWIVRADSMDAALALAAEGSHACGQLVEVRALAEGE